MTITAEQMRSVAAPFNVRMPGRKTVSTITGFSQNDPLGVGGGIFPDMPTAYFEGGGWLLVKDLMRHFELVEAAPDAKEPEQMAPTPLISRLKAAPVGSRFLWCPECLFIGVLPPDGAPMESISDQDHRHCTALIDFGALDAITAALNERSRNR